MTLKPLEPGGPFDMTIAGDNTITVHDVLVGEVWVCSGQSKHHGIRPPFRSQAVADGKVVLSFDHVGKGLEVRGERLTGFAIAGSDRRFVNADASVSGDRVVVSSPKVPAPAFVRFGWADYPAVNLWNKDGLPATPFRTDPR